MFERLAQTRPNRLGQGLRRGPSDHDDVIAQTKDDANQGIRIELLGEISLPLLTCFACNDFKARHRGANIVLQLRDARAIPTTD